MPLYEYQCQRCQRRVEKIQSFTAPPLTTCEACGGPLEKLISLSAFQLKGSGWYVTDYAKKSGVSPAAPEASGSGEKSSGDGGSGGGNDSSKDGSHGGQSETKSESKSESKPESKPEAKPAGAAAASPSK
ncbi:MAG TPA: FmdB family zinc ribbon protein [Terriglobales bacterium]|jgi:putative FmdB family regulatory protein